MNNKLEFDYHPTPKQVCRIKSLSGDSKILYSIMWNESKFFSKEKDVCYQPSEEHLAHEAGMSLRSVSGHIKKLIEHGLVAVLSKKAGCKTRYKMVDYRGIDSVMSIPSSKEVRIEKQNKPTEQEAASEQAELESEASPLPAIIENSEVISQEPIISVIEQPKETAVLTDKQLEYYCSITDTDFNHIKTSLIAEPAASVYMLQVIEEHVAEQESNKFFKSVASKADWKHRGHIDVERDMNGNISPF